MLTTLIQGAFFPYHRLYVWVHEQALRNECGYTGWQPWWDEPHDAGHFRNSSVMDPVYGFGGDGAGSSGCIQDGPFRNYTNALGPKYDITNHCINRRLDEVAGLQGVIANVQECMKLTDFVSFWICMEYYPHR